MQPEEQHAPPQRVVKSRPSNFGAPTNNVFSPSTDKFRPSSPQKIQPAFQPEIRKEKNDPSPGPIAVKSKKKGLNAMMQNQYANRGTGYK